MTQLEFVVLGCEKFLRLLSNGLRSEKENSCRNKSRIKTLHKLTVTKMTQTLSKDEPDVIKCKRHFRGRYRIWFNYTRQIRRNQMSSSTEVAFRHKTKLYKIPEVKNFPTFTKSKLLRHRIATRATWIQSPLRGLIRQRPFSFPPIKSRYNVVCSDSPPPMLLG